MIEMKKFGDFATFKYGKMLNREKFNNKGKYPVYSGYRYVGYYNDYNTEANQLIVVARGVGGTGDVKLTKERCYLTNLSIRADIDKKVALPEFIYYYYLPKSLRYLDSGSAQSQITISDLEKVVIPIPTLAVQKSICQYMKILDKKIELNNAINENLERQAEYIFDSMFPNIMFGNKTIGDYITPKRGKSLLSKNAISGDVPVVAGGLEASTYHNIANTKAPVITISASGANAGFVNLWHIPVWSSDSSFIDSSMTNDVFFWYIILKKRQKEIFDSQTGSAQPHIYPKHIAIMKIAEINSNQIISFTKQVTPLFNLIGTNIKQNEKLAKLRDALLPKLMSGEIDVSNIKI